MEGEFSIRFIFIIWEGRRDIVLVFLFSWIFDSIGSRWSIIIVFII